MLHTLIETKAWFAATLVSFGARVKFRRRKPSVPFFFFFFFCFCFFFSFLESYYFLENFPTENLVSTCLLILMMEIEGIEEIGQNITKNTQKLW